MGEWPPQGDGKALPGNPVLVEVLVAFQAVRSKVETCLPTLVALASRASRQCWPAWSLSALEPQGGDHPQEGDGGLHIVVGDVAVRSRGGPGRENDWHGGRPPRRGHNQKGADGGSGRPPRLKPGGANTGEVGRAPGGAGPSVRSGGPGPQGRAGQWYAIQPALNYGGQRDWSLLSRLAGTNEEAGFKGGDAGGVEAPHQLGHTPPAYSYDPRTIENPAIQTSSST